MARQARFLQMGAGYLISAKAKNNVVLFKEGEDFEYYLKLLRKYKKRYALNMYAFCLLEKNIYLVLQPQDVLLLPTFIQGIQQSYALYFNHKYDCIGRVWSGRYESRMLSEDKDLFHSIKLVEFMPVRESVSDSPVYYPWSSCTFRILGANDLLDTLPPVGGVRSPKFSI